MLNKLQEKLKKYDRFLSCKRKMDGSVEIIRKSPFTRSRDHEILKLENKFIGSSMSILKSLVLMDSQRKDIIKDVEEINRKIREKHPDYSHISKEVAYFMTENEKLVA